MGTYFALIRALYFNFLYQEAAKIARQSALGHVLGTVGDQIRAALRIRNHEHDPRLRFIADTLHKKFETCGFDKAFTRIHIDGDRPNQKRREHAARDVKNTAALGKLDACFVQNPQAPPPQQQQQQPPRLRKHNIAAIERMAKNVVHVPRQALLAVCHFLEEKGWRVHLCQFEADPCIARHCYAASQYNTVAYALSNDSDLFVYSSVRELIRPVWNKRNKFQQFNKQAVLTHLQLDDLQLLLVGIVTKNDYNQQFENYGVATNMEIARELRQIGMLPNNALVLGSNIQASTTMAAAVAAYINHVTNPGQAAPAAAPP
ncbi:hypothetical protein EC968_006408, partial [Mortierella alpina]